MIFNEIFKYKTKKIKFNQVSSLLDPKMIVKTQILGYSVKKKTELGYCYYDS